MAEIVAGLTVGRPVSGIKRSARWPIAFGSGPERARPSRAGGRSYRYSHEQLLAAGSVEYCVDAISVGVAERDVRIAQPLEALALVTERRLAVLATFPSSSSTPHSAARLAD